MGKPKEELSPGQTCGVFQNTRKRKLVCPDSTANSPAASTSRLSFPQDSVSPKRLEVSGDKQKEPPKPKKKRGRPPRINRIFPGYFTKNYAPIITSNAVFVGRGPPMTEEEYFADVWRQAQPEQTFHKEQKFEGESL